MNVRAEGTMVVRSNDALLVGRDLQYRGVYSERLDDEMGREVVSCDGDGTFVIVCEGGEAPLRVWAETMRVDRPWERTVHVDDMMEMTCDTTVQVDLGGVMREVGDVPMHVELHGEREGMRPFVFYLCIAREVIVID